MQDMLFAWKIVRHVKSNAIVFAKDEQTLGIGSGQTSRVDSSEIAVSKAAKEQLRLKGSAIASDAFFPFSDGVEAAACRCHLRLFNQGQCSGSKDRQGKWLI